MFIFCSLFGLFKFVHEFLSYSKFMHKFLPFSKFVHEFLKFRVQIVSFVVISCMNQLTCTNLYVNLYVNFIHEIHNFWELKKSRFVIAIFLLTGCEGCTRKYKPKVFHTAQACEENQGLVSPGMARTPS